MEIVKTKGNLRIYAGYGMAHGLFFAKNIKNGRVSLWDNKPNFKIKDCIY